MKNFKYLSFFFLIGIILISSCKKDPDLRMPDVKKGVVPNLTVAPGSDDLIDFFNPSNFAGGVVVDVYWGTDLPKSMDLIVVYKGDKTQPGLIRANITQFPTTVNFTFQDLVDALPQLDNVGQLSNSDKFDFYANITLSDGSVLHGADTLYDAVSSDVANYPNASISLRYGFFCPFDVNNFVGAYDCDEAGYGVYSVNLTKDPDVPNRVRNDNFWDFAGAGAYVYYDFSGDAAQVVTVPLQDFTFGDGTTGTVVGSGTYDACLGSMTVNYTVNYGGSDYATTHVFTPSTGAKILGLKKPKR